RRPGGSRVNLGQDAEELCLDSRQRSCSRQQLAAAGMIYATFSAASVKDGAKPGTRLVSDSMKCQQRLAHPPIAPVGEVLERYFSALTKSLPFLGQEVRECSLSILDPQVPLATGLFDRVGPAGDAPRTRWKCDSEANPRRGVATRQIDPPLCVRGLFL